MAVRNPFKPTFGQLPLVLAGRQTLIDNFLDGLEDTPGNPNRATIYVGSRGSGKTVLLQEIANRALEFGWVNANVSCAPGLLKELIVRVRKNGSEILSQPARSRITTVQAGGFGISREFEESQTTWRSEMEDLIDELNDAGSGLLIVVDEISRSLDEFKEMVIAYQHFVSEGKNVALLMAGLPSKVSAILLDDDISFIRRALQRELYSIDHIDVEQAMLATLESSGRTIDSSVLSDAAHATGGYAFMIQLIGYYMWQQHPNEINITADDVVFAIEQSSHEMERAVYVPTLQELTKREVEFVQSMVQLGDSAELSDVAEHMGVSVNNAAKLRRRLVERDIVCDLGRGRLGFDLPGLKDYLERNPLF